MNDANRRRPGIPRSTGAPRGVLAACLLSLLAVAVPAAPDRGEVVRVVDGDTLRVRISGKIETVRLIGVDAPETRKGGGKPDLFARESTRFVRQLVEGRQVRLEPDSEGDTRDGYGRLLRYVYLDDGRMLNSEIVASGFGHALTRYPFSRAAEFRELEAGARESGRGLWGTKVPDPVAASEASAHVGELATVCGRVASTKYRAEAEGGPTFLNFDRPHPHQTFTVVIWGSDREAFDEPETHYAGRDVCVEGWIRSHRGKPEITAGHPSQIVGVEPR